jgi:catechol 2,3-dioxygenase-like lactoylglutathione lyase family enzyme
MPAVVNHVGLVVSSIARSVAFYEMFGGTAHPGARFCGPEFDHAVGLDGVSIDTRMVHFNGVVLELLQYESPPGKKFEALNCDVGVSHIAFQVNDIQDEYRRLTAAGVEFFSEPKAITDGPYAGGAWCYCRDPDGVSVELIQPGA